MWTMEIKMNPHFAETTFAESNLSPSLVHETFQERVYCFRKESAPSGSKLFPLKVGPYEKGGKYFHGKFNLLWSLLISYHSYNSATYCDHF